MHWTLNALRGLSLRATDETLGKVEDVLFDDQHWGVRYVVADTRRWFGRPVLIAPASLHRPDPAGHALPIDLTRQQIEDAPSLEADQPVSRRHELALTRHYGWPAWWASYTVPAAGTPAGVPITDPATAREVEERFEQEVSEGDPHLRSAGEVLDYAIEANDGAIGRLDDVLIDDRDWMLRYLVVSTARWPPARQVILSPRWVERFEWDTRRIVFHVSRTQIEEAPDYDPSIYVDQAYEARLHGHYGVAPSR